MKRRDFLRGAGVFIAGATLAGLPGCGDDKVPANNDAAVPTGIVQFPQGVASGDPRTTSVVLWTRAVKKDGSSDTVNLQVQVSTDAAFATLVVDMAISATAESDHTVRVVVTGLAANTAYFYRFVAGGDSIGGQTHTAPGATEDVQVNIAWVSCQDYQAGSFASYRQMIADDDARAAADKIHFVVHLGDMIYETIDEFSQKALDDNFAFVTLKNMDGTDRVVTKFPSGGGSGTGSAFAQTVADYRHLYKTFLSDPDIQAARAKWPFIVTWDDHEFTNDSWQSMANYTGTASVDEPAQTRKIAASQVWFEFTPAQLSGATGPAGVAQDAKDFEGATVTNKAFTAPNADNFVDEQNNAAAIGAMTIYRSFRWGKHVELLMTDLRSYRSDHAIPEDLAGPLQLIDPRNFLPLGLVALLDQGKTANGGNPPATLPPPFNAIPNVRATSPAGTMMGKDQKAWWKATMMASDATWKLWGNEVPLMRMFVPAAGTAIAFDRVLDGDAWDGWPTERVELMKFLKDQAIKNVVVLSGDIHASFAGVINDDFDAATPTPVATELIAAGIASNSLFSFYESATRVLPAPLQSLRGLVTVDAAAQGFDKFTENLNMLILHGTLAAATFAATKSLAQAQQVFADVNPHLKYADTNAQGYGYVKVTATEVQAQIVTVNRPVGAPSATPIGTKRVASFTIPKDNPGGMTGPTITGKKPFPVN